jgi:hypothetical protein
MEPVMNRPKIALIITTYFDASHADVIGTRLIRGYPWQGKVNDPRVEVASLYLEQLGDSGSRDGGARERPDIGVAIARMAGVPMFPTVAEAIGLGHGGVAVDGVVIIGEHGDYEDNVFGEKLYPRRRLFDATVSTMISAGRFVPIFNDKHLAWSFKDARAMYDTAQRLGIPLLAGSSIPLAWRVPSSAQWRLGAPMSNIVAVGHGPVEAYGFHNLEGMQVHAERRAGGETGVVSVRGMSGDEAAAAMIDGTVDRDLFDRALTMFDLNDDQRRQARTRPQDVFLVTYADGLRAAAVNCAGSLVGFAASARGPHDELTCRTWLQGGPDHGHFIFLTRQIESLVRSGRSPYPVERTLLTGGVLDACLRSRHDGATELATPELNISYQPAGDILDTGIDLPLPDPVDQGV